MQARPRDGRLVTPPTITPALVKRACAELPPRFGAVLVDKRTNGTMARIGWFLQECGIMQAAQHDPSQVLSH